MSDILAPAPYPDRAAALRALTDPIGRVSVIGSTVDGAWTIGRCVNRDRAHALARYYAETAVLEPIGVSVIDRGERIAHFRGGDARC